MFRTNVYTMHHLSHPYSLIWFTSERLLLLSLLISMTSSSVNIVGDRCSGAGVGSGRPSSMMSEVNVDACSTLKLTSSYVNCSCSNLSTASTSISSVNSSEHQSDVSMLSTYASRSKSLSSFSMLLHSNNAYRLCWTTALVSWSLQPAECSYDSDIIITAGAQAELSVVGHSCWKLT